MLCKVLSSNVQYNGICNGHGIPLVFMLLHGKSESSCRSMWSTIRALCERRNLTLEPTCTTIHIDFEVDMHTVLNNAHCTLKNEL